MDAPELRTFVFALFFVFGGITSLNDVVIPKLKDLFTLSYGQAMLVQSAFFGAYLICSIPAAAIVARAGYMRAASIGLLIMTVGCLLFIPAAASSQYAYFLAAMFVLGAGITTVQVVSNPLISLLGPSRTASSRLTFAQAFNSLGTTIFPIIGSIIILGSLSKVDPASLTGAALDAFRAAEARVVTHTYIGLAIALTLLAGVVWTQRNRLKAAPAEESILQAFTLLKLPRFSFGTLCIFLYVGAEVSIGSLIVNYLMQADTLALPQASAGKHVALYWGGAMVGRFIGSYILRVISPGKVLAGVASAAIALILISMGGHGFISGYALLAIGLVNSIMFPTIFTLGCEGLGKRAAEGSGIICMAIVGGAIIPPLTGEFADHIGLRLALFVPALCYLIIAAFGLYAANRPARDVPNA
ncbi:sugar MFS transporter [Sphingomonas abietis]|uniref:Sugar MFS transporter n=1 Tax=Sphingomonas abietis TaxID=3012344 RepID=A0ABY7NT61_9SPHN|nr:sugar MFS transporter [Sphingomonas abietis]WBO24685.1 sugar MFS transporter [Sphingomonas abietis]